MEIKQQDQIQQKMKQKVTDLQQENDFLKTQLTDQQQCARYLQSELEHQKEVYGQLQIQVLAKQQSTGLPTVGDVSYMHLLGRESPPSDQHCNFVCLSVVDRHAGFCLQWSFTNHL